MSASLSPFRAQIDAIDAEIIDLLGRRFGVVRKVAAVKATEGLPSVLPDRIAAVKQKAAELGKAKGLNPEFVANLYQMIIDEACRLEEEHFASEHTNADGAP